MYLEELAEICNDQWQKTMDLLQSKGDDYSKEFDVLSNFKEAGAICGISPKVHCLALIATKVARLGVLFNKEGQPNNESVQDSISDLITYSFLLQAVVAEETKQNLPTEIKKYNL